MLVWKVRWSCSSVMSVMSLSGCCSPALLTSTSSWPHLSITDLVGGRSGKSEAVLARARRDALGEMQEQARQLGGNAVIGVDIDYEVLGQNGSMLMVSVSGTAVKI